MNNETKHQDYTILTKLSIFFENIAIGNLAYKPRFTKKELEIYGKLINDASAASEIHHAAKRSPRLTKKLLSFTKDVPFNEKAVDNNKLLTQQQDMLQKTLTVKISLIYDLSNELWH